MSLLRTLTIHTLNDLRMPIEEPFYISSKESDLEKEIEYNIWYIGFSDAALANITVDDTSPNNFTALFKIPASWDNE